MLACCAGVAPAEYRRLAQAARRDVEAYAADEIAARHIAFYRVTIAGIDAAGRRRRVRIACIATG